MNNQIKQKNILMKLIIFGIFITALFFYQTNISYNQDHYHKAKSTILEMKNLNQKLNNYVSTNNKFTNLDHVVDLTNGFKRKLESIKTITQDHIYNPYIMHQIKSLEETFSKKEIDIERFKSHQILSLTSITYLFELSDNLSSFAYPKHIKNALNEIIYETIKHTININSSQNSQETYFKNLQILKQSNNAQDLEFFLAHLSNIFVNSQYLQNKQNEISKYFILDKLNSIENLIDEELNENAKIQSVFSVILIISIFIACFYIYIQYQRSLKGKNDLFLFQNAIQNSNSSIFLTDENKNINYINNELCKSSQFNPSELLGQPLEMLLSKIVSSKNYEDIKVKIENLQKFEGTIKTHKKDGSTYIEEASIIPIISDNKLKNILGIKLNITDIVKFDKDLELINTAIKDSKEAIIILDYCKKIISYNEAYINMQHLDSIDIIGNKPCIFQSNFHDKTFQKNAIATLESNLPFSRQTSIFINEEKKHLWVNITPIKNQEQTSYIVTYQDISVMVETQNDLERIAYYDTLTSLPNREKIKALIQELLEQKNRSFYVLLVDIDNFKHINDTLGHENGDKVIKILANRLQSILTENDIISRFGGDEFLIIINDDKNDIDIEKIYENISQTINQTITIENQWTNITASIGSVKYPENAIGLTSILKNIDIAIIHAKRNGKNTYADYDEKLHDVIKREFKIEKLLPQAIVERKIFLNFQPQYDLLTQKIVSFEVLARWIDAELGFISPDEFIKIAEDTKMIKELGMLVLDKACESFVEFKKIKPDLSHIAINVSSIELSDNKFIDNVLAILNKYALKPNNIELELTERTIFEQTSNNIALISKLHELGFKISIDDFGTGYSSMNLLAKLPIDTIKIDKSFVQDSDNKNLNIINTIVKLASSIQASTIAEGIEIQDQEDFMRSIKCDFGQGYIYSKPLTEANTIDFLKSKQKEA